MASNASNDGGPTYPTEVDTLEVPGATLHYEVRGSGPVLLLIAAGVSDASASADVAQLLADRYTVVTYDLRGVSRSRFHGPPEDTPVEVHADDAHRLLTAIGGGPAYVYGSSSGALFGLDLVARHPEQVRALVAHEPPTVELLPDRERHRAQAREVYETYLREGVGPAMAMFLKDAGLDDGQEPGDPRPAPPAEPSAETVEPMAGMQANLDFFLAHMWRALTGHLPDLAALRAAPTRVVVAVGETTQGQAAHDAALALAERLVTDAVVVPGDHGGFWSDPDAFAEALHKVLRG
jgi:pimeloyl-ACP methyl ester carboxylesterase